MHAERKEVISVFKSKTLRLHTTRSWDFLGLRLPTANNDIIQPTTSSKISFAAADDVIVGVIDTGIYAIIIYITLWLLVYDPLEAI